MFLIQKGEIEGRLDCYYLQAIISNPLKSVFKTYPLNKLVWTTTGGTPDKSNFSYWNGDIFWVSPKDFKSLEISESQDTITHEGLKNSSTKLIESENVLIVVRSGVLQHTLPVAVNKTDVAINQDIKALIIKDRSLLNPYYLVFYFNTFQESLLPLIVKNGTTVQSINTEQFDKLIIPVPPIEKQAEIIALFETAYHAKKQKEAEAAELLASIDGYLLQELGIDLGRVGNALPTPRKFFYTSANKLSGGRFDSFYHQIEFDDYKNPVSKYQIKQIGKLAVSIQTGLPVRNDFRSENGIYPYYGANGIIGYMDEFTHDGTYLVVAQDGYIGNHYVVIGKFWASNHNWVMKLDESQIIYDYAKSVLDIWNYTYLVTGAVIPKLTKEALKSIKIPLPPLEKQTEIAAHISAIRQSAKQLQQQAAFELEQAKQHVEKLILG